MTRVYPRRIGNRIPPRGCWAGIVFLAIASPLTAGLSAGFNIGTLGAGVDLTTRPTASIGLRAGVNYAQWKQTVILDDAEVEGRLRWLTAPLLIDWYPARGGFRLSAGLALNGNRVDLTVTPYETVELSGEDYIIESLDGSIRFPDTAPYAGIGYRTPPDEQRRWFFSCDVGVMFHGRPRISAQAVAADPRWQAEVDRALQEEIDSLDDDLRDFRFYPLIALGVSRRF